MRQFINVRGDDVRVSKTDIVPACEIEVSGHMRGSSNTLVFRVLVAEYARRKGSISYRVQDREEDISCTILYGA
jgi:hypothetical protein